MSNKAFVFGANGPRKFSLKYARTDAENFSNVLMSPRCNYEVVIPNPGEEARRVVGEFDDLVDSCNSTDTLICYFACHGYLRRGKLLLICDDFSEDRINGTSIRISHVLDVLEECKAHSKLLILDCCHAGAAAGGRNVPIEIDSFITPPNNFQLLLASDKLELARELDSLGGGFLTHFICKALSDDFHEADLNSDNKLSVDELYAWVLKKAEIHNRENPSDTVPVPILSGEKNSDFVITVDANVWQPYTLNWPDDSKIVVLPAKPIEFRGKKFAIGMGKSPVTNAQYQNFLRVVDPICQQSGMSLEPVGDFFSSSSQKLVNWKGPFYPFRNEKFRNETLPVVCVSWWGVRAYCSWVNESLRSVGMTFIPLEKIWNLASFGDPICPTKKATKIVTDAEKNIPRSTMIGSSNVRGLTNLVGNVWQWVTDVDFDTLLQKERLVSKLFGGSFLYETESSFSLQEMELSKEKSTARFDVGFRIAALVPLNVLPELTVQKLELFPELISSLEFKKYFNLFEENLTLSIDQCAEEIRKYLKRSANSSTPSKPKIDSEHERRKITVLACLVKIVGDDAQQIVDEFLLSFNQYFISVVEQHNGSHIYQIGNTFYACFGYPEKKDEDIVKAVKAGLCIFENSQVNKEITYRVCIGIHTDQAIVNFVGDGKHGKVNVHGQIMEFANTLAKLAEPEGVLLSRDTRESICQQFLTVKDNLCFRVLREKEFATRFINREFTIFVGRSKALEKIRVLWKKVNEGKLIVFCIHGIAGIGKSRLVQEIKKELGTRDLIRLTCQCWPEYKNSSFYPIINLFRQTSGISLEDSKEEQIKKLKNMLTTFSIEEKEFDIYKSLLSISTYSSPLPRPKTITKILINFLEKMATIQPVLCVVEDVHWADPSTKDLLYRLSKQVSKSRILTLITSRSSFFSDKENEINLLPLGEDEARTLIKQIASDKKNKISFRIEQKILQRAEGIPLALEELTEMVVESSKKVSSSTLAKEKIPDELYDVYSAKFWRMSKIARNIAQMAAVLGRAFDYHILCSMWMKGEDGKEALTVGMEDLKLAGIFKYEGTYFFNHALVRDAVYETLTIAKRKEIHCMAAVALVDSAYEKTQPELIAYHYNEAEKFSEAMKYWVISGEFAVKNSANYEAISLFRKALDALLKQKLPKKEEQELTILLSLGPPLMAVKGYASDDVNQVYSRAKELCSPSMEDKLFFALHGIWEHQMVGGRLKNARSLADELNSISKKTINQLTAKRALGTTLLLLGKIYDCNVYTSEGLELFEKFSEQVPSKAFGHNPGVALLLYKGWSLTLMGYSEDGKKCVNRAVVLARQNNDSMTVGFALCYAAIVFNYCNEYEKAKDFSIEAINFSTKKNLSLWTALGNIQLGWSLFSADPKKSIELIEDGIRGWQKTGALSGSTFFYAVQTDLEFKMNNKDKALQALLQELIRKLTKY